MNRLFNNINNSSTINNFNLINREVSYQEVRDKNLTIDTLYRNGHNLSDEAISSILDSANMGGLRYRGSMLKSLSEVDYIVLYSTLSEDTRPDYFITPASLFMYYGDNKKGRDLLDTPRRGNLLLKKCFDALYEGKRDLIPPIFIFTRGVGGATFRGLAVPGASGLDITNALIKIETSVDDTPTLNYKATFTILDEVDISRKWIDDILGNIRDSSYIPASYKLWKDRGVYTPLKNRG